MAFLVKSLALILFARIIGSNGQCKYVLFVLPLDFDFYWKQKININCGERQAIVFNERNFDQN